jgi:hypothetical protein
MGAENYQPAHLRHMAARGVACLDMLSPEAQEAAMKNIIATDRLHHRHDLNTAKSFIRLSLHGCINDPYFMERLRRRSVHIRRMERDADYCRHYILQNLCEFDAEGRFKPYRTEALSPYVAGMKGPAFGSTFLVKGDVDRYQINRHQWRVSGYMKATPRPKFADSFNGELDELLFDSCREFTADKVRLMWCPREEAEYVTGSGVCGVIKRLDEIEITGMVAWSQEQIDEAERSSFRNHGRMLF